MGHAIEIAAADGIIDVLIFTPDNAGDPLPEVVLFTDVSGLPLCNHERLDAQSRHVMVRD